MTKDEAREAAERLCHAKNLSGDAHIYFEQGVMAGYEAAVAAERERIVAELEKEKDDELFETPFDIVMDRAIEIVKGGEK